MGVAESALLNATEGTPEYEAASHAYMAQLMRERGIKPSDIKRGQDQGGEPAIYPSGHDAARHGARVPASADTPRAHALLMGAQSFFSVYLIAWSVWYYAWHWVPVVITMAGLSVKILGGVRSKDGSKGGTTFVALTCAYLAKCAIVYVQLLLTGPDVGLAGSAATYVVVAALVVKAMAVAITCTTNAVLYAALSGVGAVAVFTEGYGGKWGAGAILIWAGIFMFIAPKTQAAPAENDGVQVKVVRRPVADD